ncbi:WD40/YVTN/BNR-like repeat-containing protein [Umezawaea endophytica]|uniref:WD40/YVTN/BNR-like repeat-containing protein n=1 Tax=Umezawaea endophytica TaxID=1654476 RepID=UPI0035F0CABE
MRVLGVVVAVLLSLLVPGVSSASGGLAWVIKPTGTDAQLRGLSVVDARVVWASGSKGTVLRTVDGGASWASVGPPDTAGLEFRDVEAFDALNAVVLSIGPGDSSRIYRTVDGGRSWTLAFRNAEEKAFYDCVAFFDRWRGLAMGDPVDGKFRVLSTVDGGRSWTLVPESNFPPALEGEAGFAASGQCIATSGPFDAWFATGGGASARVLHSGDGGRHWKASDTPLLSLPSAGVFAVAFRTPWQGIAVGGDYARPAEPVVGMALSGDRGRSWSVPAVAPVGYRSGVAWRGASVIAVGPTGSDVSVDGGRRWRSFDGGSFDTVDCGWGRVCWASGGKGRVGVLRG